MPLYAHLKNGEVFDIKPNAATIASADIPRDQDRRPTMLPYQEEGLDGDKDNAPDLWTRSKTNQVGAAKVVGLYSYALKNDIEEALLRRVDVHVKVIHADIAGSDNLCALRVLISCEGEARRYLAADNPVAGDYPLLAQEVGQHPDTADLAAAARQCLAGYAAFARKVQMVNMMAAGIKQAIRDANDSVAKLAAYQDADFTRWEQNL